MSDRKIGILGGGQLGRMLLQAASNYDAEVYILEKTTDCPAAGLASKVVVGDLLNQEDVLAFGRMVDVITIEIEHVNADALAILEAEGKTVFPSASVIKTIQDKGLQKQFYADNKIPTSPFAITQSKEDIKELADLIPAFHKLRRFGYDGRGVQSIKTESDWEKGFEEPGVLEKAVEIDKELSVIIIVNENGEMESFPPVELVFDPELNLVDYLLSPAQVSESIGRKAVEIAEKTVSAFKSPGIFAVEMFLDPKGEILVNEIAPRTHNSGHQSIEGNFSSQFDQQIRMLMGLPAGDSSAIKPSLMINLIGEPGFQGPPIYEGMDEILSLPGVYVHLYAKKETRPGRKMGHVTLIADDIDSLLQRAEIVKQTIRVIA